MLKHCANIHLLSGAGFDCQLQNLDSVMPPGKQFNWGIGWTISVLADTLKSDRNGSRMYAGDRFADFSRIF